MHLVPHCVLLSGRCDPQEPEDGGADPSDRCRHGVNPQQVSPVDREARDETCRQHRGHEHRGCDDGVSGPHGPDLMVPHDGDGIYLQS